MASFIIPRTYTFMLITFGFYNIESKLIVRFCFEIKKLN